MAQKSRKFSSRILVIVLLSYVLTSFYYIITIYRSKIEASENATLDRLESISNTLASEINGTMMKMVLDKYENKDDFTNKYADPYIREIVEGRERAVWVETPIPHLSVHRDACAHRVSRVCRSKMPSQPKAGDVHRKGHYKED